MMPCSSGRWNARSARIRPSGGSYTVTRTSGAPRSLQSETVQERCDQLLRRCRDVEGLAEVVAPTPVQDVPFLRDGPQLELLLVERACTLATLDPAQVLVERKGEEEAADVRLRLDVEKSPPQVVELLGRAPEVVDDEVTVASTPMVRDEQCDGRVQVPISSAGGGFAATR